MRGSSDAVIFPEGVRAALERLEQAGFKAYAVGGCVRDSLLGREPHDWDLTTSATPDEVLENFRTPPFSAYSGNGLKHGTVTVVWHGDRREEYEITTFRREAGYSDCRRPDEVFFSRSLTEDLARRDFTVNAMASRPRPDGKVELVDVYSGRKDLAKGILRCVREPEERFREDALRIMRGLRFAAVYGFTVEPRTAEAMVRVAPALRRIAAERIVTELLPMLSGVDAGRVADTFHPVLECLLDGAVPAHCEEMFRSLPEVPARLALLFGDRPTAEVSSFLRERKYGEATVRRVTELLEGRNLPLGRDHRNVCLLLRRYGAESGCFCRYRAARGAPADACRMLAEALAAAEQRGDCCRECQLALRGGDLLERGIPRGAEVGRCLSFLLEQVISGRLSNERDALAAAVTRYAENLKISGSGG